MHEYCLFLTIVMRYLKEEAIHNRNAEHFIFLFYFRLLSDVDHKHSQKIANYFMTWYAIAFICEFYILKMGVGADGVNAAVVAINMMVCQCLVLSTEAYYIFTESTIWLYHHNLHNKTEDTIFDFWYIEESERERWGKSEESDNFLILLILCISCIHVFFFVLATHRCKPHWIITCCGNPAGE